MFYAFSYEKASFFKTHPAVLAPVNPLSQFLNVGSSEQVPVKFVLFPTGKNKINVRLENIGDKFDAADQTVYVKLHDFA